MITGFVNAISKSGFQNLIQNTTAQVSIETGLKAAGRPAFTLMDKNVDKETRKYAATKELLYQVLCLGIYLAIIPPIFKKTSFKVFKNVCNKLNNEKEFLKKISNGKIENCSINMFKNEEGLLSLYKLSHMEKAERLDPKNKNAVKYFKKLKDNLDFEGANKEISEKIVKNANELEKGDDFFRQFYLGKGGIEMGSIAGSVIGLTILAPELSHLVLHPIMKACGLEKAHPKKTEAQEQKTETLNTQA